MRIVFLDESTVNLNGDIDLSAIQSLGQLVCFDNSTEEDALVRGAGARILIVNKVPMTARVFDNLAGLGHVAEVATGTNNIDSAAAAQAGVSVSNVPGYASSCVAQHVFALILNLATHVHEYDRDVKAGDWQRSAVFTLLTYPTFELAGKTLGIVGFGAIGREVARIAQVFGLRILVHTRSPRSGTPYLFCSLPEIFKESDIVTLHCPLTKENRGMVTYDLLRSMKKNAIFINTARGPLVDQEALAQALNQGWIAGAGLDVLEQEPPRANPLLSGVKNLIITPHSAWSAREARQRLIDQAAENIKAFQEGRERNLVRG